MSLHSQTAGPSGHGAQEAHISGLCRSLRTPEPPLGLRWGGGAAGAALGVQQVADGRNEFRNISAAHTLLPKGGCGGSPCRGKAPVSVGTPGLGTEDRQAAKQKPSEWVRPCQNEASLIQAFTFHQQNTPLLSFDLHKEHSGRPWKPAMPSPQLAGPTEGQRPAEAGEAGHPRDGGGEAALMPALDPPLRSLPCCAPHLRQRPFTAEDNPRATHM